MVKCYRDWEHHPHKVKHPAITELRITGGLVPLIWKRRKEHAGYKAVPQNGLISDWFLFCPTAMRIAPPLITETKHLAEISDRLIGLFLTARVALPFIQAMIKKITSRCCDPYSIYGPLAAALVVTKTAETCSDGLLNQDEYWIDCGGPCKFRCQTRSDGLQNQGENRHWPWRPQLFGLQSNLPFAGNFGVISRGSTPSRLKAAPCPALQTFTRIAWKPMWLGATLTIRIVSTGSDPARLRWMVPR